jgi:hypothetical protein
MSKLINVFYIFSSFYVIHLNTGNSPIKQTIKRQDELVKCPRIFRFPLLVYTTGLLAAYVCDSTSQKLKLDIQDRNTALDFQ